MSWNDVWKIVLTVITSIGGIGVIVITTIKFLVKTISKRFEEKYSHKLNEELEKFKTELDKKLYISKARFDTEFKLYQDICSAFSEMVQAVNELIPYGVSYRLANKEAELRLEHKLAINLNRKNQKAETILNANIPFIKEEFYNSFTEMLSLSKRQLNSFLERYDKGTMKLISDREFTAEDYERTKVLIDKYLNMCVKIGDYLREMDVLEEK